MTRAACVFLLLLSGCKRDAAPGADAGTTSSSTPPVTTPTAPSARTTHTCAVVTEADVTAALGGAVTRHAFEPAIGAGSTCDGNFTTPDKNGNPTMVLMVQDYTDTTLFESPHKLQLDTFTPIVEAPTGLGADAKLFLAKSLPDATQKSLMLRKNGKLFVLQTFNDFGQYGNGARQFDKAKLLALGKVVASHM